ncbi:MAG: DUF2064 domain-containing protein [Zetaproteobacteria bacterium]|nr:MAG: DUF2064 domain-containing protein [Zetaproteobacteria bacterium]
MRMRALQVVIMCKAPIPGKVKTRMVAAGMTPAEACALHREMARAVIRRAARLFPGRVTVAGSPAGHPFFAGIGLPVVDQGGGDLGGRMARVARPLLEAGRPVLLLGTDAPHMAPERLQRAVAAADDHDAVVGPVEDGGYDLLLLTTPAALALLEGIDWGSDRVSSQTRARAHARGLSLAWLEPGFDVDAPADLARSRAAGWPE